MRSCNILSSPEGRKFNHARGIHSLSHQWANMRHHRCWKIMGNFEKQFLELISAPLWCKEHWISQAVPQRDWNYSKSGDEKSVVQPSIVPVRSTAHWTIAPVSPVTSYADLKRYSIDRLLRLTAGYSSFEVLLNVMRGADLQKFNVPTSLHLEPSPMEVLLQVVLCQALPSVACFVLDRAHSLFLTCSSLVPNIPHSFTRSQNFMFAINGGGRQACAYLLQFSFPSLKGKINWRRPQTQVLHHI